MAKKKAKSDEQQAAEAVPESNSASEKSLSDEPVVIADDDQDVANKLETAEYKRLLEEAKREVKNLQNRISTISQADQFIIEAELACDAAAKELDELDKSRKEAKKRSDGALANLRKAVRDRMAGQPYLPFPEETPKPTSGEETQFVPVATQVVAGSAADDDDEERPVAAVEPVPVPAVADHILDARIGSVSVPAGTPDGDMIAIPANIVGLLEKAGFTTVRQLAPALKAKTLKVSGLGPVKIKELASIVEMWTGGNGAAAVSEAVAEAAKSREKGEATHRACGACRHYWPLPSAVMKCSECGEEQSLYDVGYYGEPGADDDGSLVINVETALIRIPKTERIPGIEQYVFAVYVASAKDGLYRNGWEINFGDETLAEYPSVISGDATDRATAIALGFGRIMEQVEKLFSAQHERDIVKSAIRERVGIDPK